MTLFLLDSIQKIYKNWVETEKNCSPFSLLPVFCAQDSGIKKIQPTTTSTEEKNSEFSESSQRSRHNSKQQRSGEGNEKIEQIFIFLCRFVVGLLSFFGVFFFISLGLLVYQQCQREEIQKIEKYIPNFFSDACERGPLFPLFPDAMSTVSRDLSVVSRRSNIRAHFFFIFF